MTTLGAQPTWASVKGDWVRKRLSEVASCAHPCPEIRDLGWCCPSKKPGPLGLFYSCRSKFFFCVFVFWTGRMLAEPISQTRPVGKGEESPCCPQAPSFTLPGHSQVNLFLVSPSGTLWAYTKQIWSWCHFPCFFIYMVKTLICPWFYSLSKLKMIVYWHTRNVLII